MKKQKEYGSVLRRGTQSRDSQTAKNKFKTAIGEKKSVV